MATRKATLEEIERLGLDEAAAGAAPKEDWDAVSFATGVARSIGQGITFGFADEAEAYVRSILGDQTYEEAKKATNAELAKFRGENPFLSFGLEIGAAIMTPGGLLKIASKVPGLAKVAQKGMQVTTPATRGMAGGALYGAGAAETKADIPASMVLGGTLGYAGTKMAPGGDRRGEEADAERHPPIYRAEVRRRTRKDRRGAVQVAGNRRDDWAD